MTDSDIAIVGMACIYPGAADLHQFWSNVRDGVDAITDMPASGWDPVFFDPSSKATDRIPCRRGGFIDAQARFDPLRHGVMPAVAKAAEPDQLLALEVATRALEDAGYGARPPTTRCGVIIGRATIIGPGHARFSQHIRLTEQLLVALRELLPGLDSADLLRVKEEFQRKTDAASTDGVIGLVPNLLASRIANRFDFNGPAYTLDAACASSLVAVDHACAELRSGRAELMICGGVHICRDEAFWSVFSQLGALSTSHQIRPFDENADGLVIGEGLGLLVLKRMSDAVRDGHRIYAAIRGTGTSSDGKGASLVSPRVEGQLRSLEAAWQTGKLDPADIGLLEAHGTGTPTGDATEVETLGRFFGPARKRTAALGSIKSMIGHTMPAAGAAGLIKAALAVYHGVKPPTLHCMHPRRDLEGTMFRVQQAAEAWDETRRIAAVNAFGFGGVNGHVLIESAPRARPTSKVRSREGGAATAPAMFAGPNAEALLAAIDANRRGGSGSARLAVLNPTPERLARAREIVQRGRRVQGAFDISFTPHGLIEEGGKIAFLFPGFDAQFGPRVDDLVDPSEDLPDLVSDEIVTRGKAILWLNSFITDLLAKRGVRPDVVAGHSLGDLSAMTVAGMLREAEVQALLEGLRPGVVALAEAAYVAAGCGRQQTEQVLAGIPDVFVSHDNCPHQSVVCTSEARLAKVLERFAAAGVIAGILPFRSGMHTPYFAPFLENHAALARIATFERPRCPVYSATIAACHTEDLDRARQVVIDHLIKPVRFRELIEKMYADGVRVFVQAGAGGLTQFVGDTLRGLPHLAISANVASCSGREQLTRVLCNLWVEGAAPDLPSQPQHTEQKPDTSILLRLGVPFVHFESALHGRFSASIDASASRAAPWQQRFERNMAQIAQAQRDVVSAVPAQRDTRPRAQSQRGAEPSAAPFTRVVRRTIGLEAFPELVDHTFHRQPAGSSDERDRKSIVPLAGLITLIVEAVEQVMPGWYAVEICDVVAMRWLAAAEPFELEISCAFDGADQVSVELISFAKGTVRLARSYPSRPSFDPPPLVRERRCAIRAAELYTERLMFHGPAYQGVVALGPLGDNGMCARLSSLPGLGALIDCAAQVLGYWVMQHVDVDQLTVPARVDRVRLYGRHPAPGQDVECMAEVVSVDPRIVRGKLTLAESTGVWAEIDGWIDRRVPCDEQLWKVIRFPERELLAQTPEPGLAIFNDQYRDVLTRDYLAGLYLVATERELLAKEPPRDKRSWLSARIAARDAVRHWQWARFGARDVFPTEVRLEAIDPSSFRATSGEQDPVWVALVRVGDTTVARVTDGGAR